MMQRLIILALVVFRLLGSVTDVKAASLNDIWEDVENVFSKIW
jgi:hypothetical protein